MRQIEEALARQVIFGGDLVTNLLEVARIDEAAVARVLAEEAGLVAAPSGELPIDPSCIALLPKETALARQMVPYAQAGQKLLVAVADRVLPKIEQEISRATGRTIEQRAASAVRVKQALARAYGAPLERRLERLLSQLGGRSEPADRATSAPWRLESLPPNPGEPLTLSPNVGEFSPAPAPVVDLDDGPETPRRAPSQALVERGIPPQVRASQRAVSAAPPARTRGGESSIPSPPAPQKGRDNAPVRGGARRRRGPITLDAARAEAREADNRDALLDLWLDFSRQFFDYAAVFIVHGDVAEGRDSVGAGAPRDSVLGIGVPLDFPSVLSRAREGKTVITIAPSKEGLDAVLLRDIGRPASELLSVVPLLVKSRTVALLLGDWADGASDDSSLADLAAFAVEIGRAFERIIVQRKQQGAGGAPPSSGGANAALARQIEEDAATIESAIAIAEANGTPSVSGLAVAHRILTPTSASHSDPPPPPGLAVVRRPSGPPIPREEPPQTPPPKRLESLPLEAAPREGFAVQGRNSPSAAARALADETMARALLSEFGTAPGIAPREVTPEGPPRAAAISVAPHLPPTSRASGAPSLPSIIVDFDAELAPLVERFVSNPDDESAEAELLHQGARALSAIMARFPGPIAAGKHRDGVAKERASECGPVLRLVAAQRRIAVPFVIAKLSDPSPNVRYWATVLLSELPYPETIPALIERYVDSVPEVRKAAEEALLAIGKSSPQAVIDPLAGVLASHEGERADSAIEALRKLRDPSTIPTLLEVLNRDNRTRAEAARQALIELSAQDFGFDIRAWRAWWSANASRHRVEWLTDALVHESIDIRRAAALELRNVTHEYFGYAEGASARERERAQQRYRDWWLMEGRHRLSRK